MILIVGTGAVGTVLATQLLLGRQSVALYARPKDRARFSGIEELKLEFVGNNKPARQVARPDLRDSLDLDGIDFLLLAIKARDVGALIQSLPRNLPRGLRLLSTLNGIAPLRQLRSAFPGAAITPVSIMFNVQSEAPLHARLTTRPEVIVGGMDQQSADLLTGTDLVVRMAEGDSAVWGKLMINLANAICAITHSTFRDLFTDPNLRQVYVRALDETVDTLNATATSWKLPLIIPFPVYRFLLLHGGPLPWWFAHYRNGVGEGAFPSMVADLRAGRTTEIEELNGEIVRMGVANGCATPTNSRLVELVKQCGETGSLTASELRLIVCPGR